MNYTMRASKSIDEIGKVLIDFCRDGHFCPNRSGVTEKKKKKKEERGNSILFDVLKHIQIL